MITLPIKAARPLVMICCLTAALAAGARAAPPASSTYPAADTLDIQPGRSPDARRLLGELAWTPGPFPVTVRNAAGIEFAPGLADEAKPDALVTFPSPRPRGEPADPVNTVVLEWYAAGNGDSTPVRAPAALVLHILDGRMTVARAIARTLAEKGIHAFVMHMPGYGQRPIDRWLLDGAVFFELAVQAVADARRAHDAIAALPRIDPNRISIQGTSFGGFIAAGAAAVDTVFDQTFIMLAGGNLFEMLQNGRHDTALIRRAFEQAGFTGEKLRQLCETVEPTTIADRLDPQRTWMFNATADRVVPAANARALADAADLDDAHHIWFAANHYTGVLHLPWIVNKVAAVILQEAGTGLPPGAQYER